jgi:hypothetical protein
MPFVGKYFIFAGISGRGVSFGDERNVGPMKKGFPRNGE